MAAFNTNDLKNEINSQFPDNNSQEITPSRLRSVCFDIVDSLYNLLDTGSKTIASVVNYNIDLSASFGPLSLVNKQWVEDNFTMAPRYLSSPAISINTTANTEQDKINDAFEDVDAGDYLITLSSLYSYDAANSSMVIRMSINGTLQGTSNEVVRIEPKDTGGNDGDGRGTSQKLPSGGLSFPYTHAGGDIDIIVDFFGVAAGVEAAMWSTVVKLEAATDAS